MDDSWVRGAGAPGMIDQPVITLEAITKTYATGAA
ncbi:MAG: hypothetical protein QOE63_989, partial [Acidimicrobiaceae bacterium]